MLRFGKRVAVLTAGAGTLLLVNRRNDESWLPFRRVHSLFWNDKQQADTVAHNSNIDLHYSFKDVPTLASRLVKTVVLVRTEVDITIKTGMFSTAEKLLVSKGAGFFIQPSKDDGTGPLVVTNAHVVNDVLDHGKIWIMTSDGHEFEAVLHSTDPWSDFALLRIHQADLERFKSLNKHSAVELGNSRDLRMGEWLLTFGHPLGLAHSLTMGIVSSPQTRTNRDIEMVGKMDGRLQYLQTNFNGFDFGNSGGPVFDMHGKLVAINVIKAISGGINFSVTIDSALPILRQLMDSNHVHRPWIGVRLLTVGDGLVDQVLSSFQPSHQQEEPTAVKSNGSTTWNDRLLKMFSLPSRASGDAAELAAAEQEADEGDLFNLFNSGVQRGVLVLAVFQRSPAAKANLCVGDVITHANGTPISNISNFFSIVGNSVKPFTLQVKRSIHGSTDIQDITLVVTPDELDLFNGPQMPVLNEDSADNPTYRQYFESLDAEQREKLEFLGRQQ